jgi:phage N-6-adenine-methyltransferase
MSGARTKPPKRTEIEAPAPTPRAIAPLVDKGREDWETPPWLFELLHRELSFDIDAAAAEHNALLPRFWTAREDGLRQSWRGLRVFVNPPYGMKTGVWVEKAFRETRGGGCPLAALVIPANTETFWWHDFAMVGAAEIRFIRRRIHFLLGGRRVPNSRPVFSSAVVIFREGVRVGPCVTTSIDAPDPKRLQDGRIIPQADLFPELG